jgi:hypothetical protein
MKIRVKRTFIYRVGPQELRTLSKGEYRVPQDVPKHIATMAMRMRRAVRVVEPKRTTKKAPENKVVSARSNKSAVEGSAVHRSGSRSKSD